MKFREIAKAAERILDAENTTPAVVDGVPVKAEHKGESEWQKQKR